MSNPKIITKHLQDNNMANAKPTSVPYVKNADLTKRKSDEDTVNIKEY